MKNIILSLLYYLAIILVSIFIVTVFGYFNIFESSTINLLKTLISFISIFISSFIIGTKSVKNGYVEGLKIGGIVVILFLIISLTFGIFSWKSLIYYLIILIVSSLGGMVGINFKKLN